MNCFICNKTLTDANASDEHIILNSLGGRLHSKVLLCKECNNKMGKQADAALSETLKFAASQLDVKRYRGENQVIQTAEGETYDMAPGCKPVLKKPSMKAENQTDGSVKVEMSARSRQEARKMLKSLQRKYPTIDIEAAMAKAQIEKRFIGTPIQMQVKFDGKKIFPSITKTALEFYLERGGEKSQIAHLIPYLLEKEEAAVCWYYYPEQPVVSLGSDEICHVICVTGNAQEGILYGYVDLFGILQCLVLLNDHYTGIDFSESYVYEVNQVKEVPKTVSLRLPRSEISRITQGKENTWTEGLKRQMILFQQKAGEINKKRILDTVWERALDNSLKKYPEGIPITEEMMAEFIKELEKEIIPWYVSRICGEDL